MTGGICAILIAKGRRTWKGDEWPRDGYVIADELGYRVSCNDVGGNSIHCGL